MKIAYLCSTLKDCGPNNVVFNIIQHLDKNFSAMIITLSPNPNNSYVQEYEKLNVKIYPLNFSRIEGLFYASKKVQEILNETKPDVVHHHGFRADVLSALKLRDYKTVSTLHCDPFYDYSFTYNKVLGRMMAHIQMKALHHIDNPIVVSENISKGLKENHQAHFNFIRNGVEIDTFQPADLQTKKNLREKLNLPQDKKLFISVGHLSSRKNPLSLIEGFKKLDNDNACLVFLGDGPLESACKSSSQGVKNIKFIGMVQNVSDYLKASDFFISAALAEGLPNSVLEGLACGLPVLLSDNPSHREIMDDSGDVGIFFDSEHPEHPEHLKDAIQTIYKKDYQTLSQNSRDLILKNFSAKMMSENYQHLYKTLSRTNTSSS